MVRRCVHRATGQEFAVKIMEVTAERLSPEQLEEVREATRRETHILRQVAGHPHISEAAFPTPVSPAHRPPAPALPPHSAPLLLAPLHLIKVWPAFGPLLPPPVLLPSQEQPPAASGWKRPSGMQLLLSISGSLPLCLFPQSLSSIPTSLLASCSWCLTCEYPPSLTEILFLSSLHFPSLTAQWAEDHPAHTFLCSGSDLPAQGMGPFS